MIELREMNPMPLAVAWLIQQSGKTNFTQEDLVERCRLGEIRLFAATPDWKAVGVGEIEMKCHVEKMDPRAQATGIVLGDGTVWISDHPLVKIRDFVSRDGLTLVSPEMASRLLIHGEASLDSVRMTVFNCGPGGETISDEPLIGTHDGRMVNFSHLRVRKSALEAFALALEGRELEDTRHESIPQFNKGKRSINYALSR